MAYPASLDELTDGVPSDGTAAATSLGDATYQHDDHHRALAVAVEAVEAELGTAPSGASATVAARFGTLTNDVFTGAVSFGGGISLTGTSSVADRKITMQSTQTVYLPDQAAFPETVFVGNGGPSMAAGAERNTGLGVFSLYALTTGVYNTGAGAYALRSLTTGGQNTATGLFSLYTLTTGGLNVAAGVSALYDLTTGSSNVALGHDTARGITTGSGNTILGAGITGLAAGAANLTLVGNGAGLNQSGTTVTAVGASAAESNTGNAVVVVGTLAGWSGSGANSTLLGYGAGYTQTGANTVAVGLNAATGNTGASGVFLGAGAGASNTHDHVICLGKDAIATGANRFVVGSTGSTQLTWHPGHDPNSYLYWDGSDGLSAYVGGDLGFCVGRSGGGAIQMGFFGQSLTAKPTGVAVSAAGIHAALVSLGLIAA